MQWKQHCIPPVHQAEDSAAAAKLLQSCLTLCDPIVGSPPGSAVPGSGLPFPSPMHESEKWKGSYSVVSDPQRPHGLQPTRLLHPWDFPGKSTGVGCHWHLAISGDIFDCHGLGFRRCYHWHLVDRGQGCWQTSYNAQDSPSTIKNCPKMLLVPLIRNPDINK